MIYFDSSRVFGTASYYLWKLFGENVPSYTVKTEVITPGAENFKIAGQIGVGTWNTSAEFKDVSVEQNGKQLLSSSFEQSAEGWQPAGARRATQWSVTEGAYRQSQNTRASSYAGDTNWSDYTLTLKARKLSGGEGFLVMFGRQGSEMYWWNLGGWGNTRHSIEHSLQGTQTSVGDSVAGQIESGRWYDIKIEVAGDRIRCYLDSNLVHDERAKPALKFFASAGPDASNENLIVKVINTAAEPRRALLDIAGGTAFDSEVQIAVLTSLRLSDNNSLEQPKAVIPTVGKLSTGSKSFEHEFPAQSLTVLKLRRK
jgi:alpha-L-arabinofuranosidase